MSANDDARPAPHRRGQGTGEPGRMGAARRSRRVLSPGCALRLGRSRVHAHLGSRARPRAPLPDQPLWSPVRRDHRFESGQDRPRRAQGHGQPLRHQSRGVHDPQRDPCRARGRKVRAARPQRERRGRVGAESGSAAAVAAGDGRAVLARLPRLRRNRAPRGREATAGARSRRSQLPDAAQSRAARPSARTWPTRFSSCMSSRQPA